MLRSIFDRLSPSPCPDIEKVSSLLALAPSAEDIASLTEYTGDRSALGKVDVEPNHFTFVLRAHGLSDR